MKTWLYWHSSYGWKAVHAILVLQPPSARLYTIVKQAWWMAETAAWNNLCNLPNLGWHPCVLDKPQSNAQICCKSSFRVAATVVNLQWLGYNEVTERKLSTFLQLSTYYKSTYPDPPLIRPLCRIGELNAWSVNRICALLGDLSQRFHFKSSKIRLRDAPLHSRSVYAEMYS